MKKLFAVVLMLTLAILSLVSCKGAREEIGKATKAIKNVKKVVEQAKTAASDNPLKKAKVGDYIKFRMITETMGTKTQMEMKHTVIAKDETSVTLRTETTAMGMKMPPQDSKIMLNQPYEPYKQGFTDAVVTPLGEGSETINVNGKSYNCRWGKVKVVSSKPNPVEAVTTVWSSPDVPVNGVVKMVTTSTMNFNGNSMSTKMTMELIEAKS
jgi:hypothetical protein